MKIRIIQRKKKKIPILLLRLGVSLFSTSQLHETLRLSTLISSAWPWRTVQLSSMAKTLIFSPQFIGAPLPSRFSRHGPCLLPHRKLLTTRVRVSLHEIPPIHSFDSAIDFNAIATRAESLLYTLADAAVIAGDSAASSGADAATDAAAQKNGGWFGFISEAMEFVLKVIVI